VFNRAGRLVEEGEEIEFDEIRIRIERVDNTRIMSARVTVLDGAEGSVADVVAEDDALESSGEPRRLRTTRE